MSSIFTSNDDALPPAERLCALAEKVAREIGAINQDVGQSWKERLIEIKSGVITDAHTHAWLIAHAQRHKEQLNDRGYADYAERDQLNDSLYADYVLKLASTYKPAIDI